ncbi:MAG: phage tail protein [Plesiomonas shigelloides]
MTQLSELTHFIENNMPARISVAFSSEMTNITLVNSHKQLGNGAMRCSVRQYDAVLTWEAWPFRLTNPDWLFALIDGWLHCHANPLREEMQLGEPQIEVDVNDQEEAWIEVTIALVDPIVLVEDEKGDIPYGNRRYRLDDATVWVAEDMHIEAAHK